MLYAFLYIFKTKMYHLKKIVQAHWNLYLGVYICNLPSAVDVKLDIQLIFVFDTKVLE